MNETTITYEVTAEDYYNYGKENASSQKEYHPTIVILIIMYLLFIFSDLIYSAFFGALKGVEINSLIINILIRFGLTFFLIFIAFGIINFIVNNKTRQISESGKNALIGKHKLILTKNELIEITDFFTNRSLWKVIGDLEESENYLFFGSATAFTYVIPKKYFDDGKKIENFINTFNKYKQKSLNEYIPSYFALLDEK